MADVDLEPSTIDEKVRRWVEEIDLSREREKEWRKDGREAEDLYEAVKKGDEDSFNVLYSNTETLAPSLYGAMPRPVVQRRFRDDDPLGKAVSMAGQRLLEFLLDTNSEEYESFDESIKEAVLDALLPGRGLTEFVYHAEVADLEAGSRLMAECVYARSFVWNRLFHAYAKKWSDVQWVALELYLDKTAVEKEFGSAIAAKMKYTYEGDANKDKKDEGKTIEEKTKIRTACIYKIWDKKNKEIVWVSPNHPTDILRTDEDELKLTGFYPFPKPLRFMRKSNNLMPTTLYRLYRTQAKELNTISLRLIHLLKACKVRGVYDSTIGEIEDVMKAEENALLPAENVAAIQNTKGLEGAIWLVPIDKIIQVIKELYLAREQCKQVIYEITGISDIIRGQTKASETLGAQKIKETWVTLRLKNMQKEVQRYVRDALRIMLEISAKRFQESTWAAMTGLPFTTTADYQHAQALLAGVQQNAAGTGQPPQIPPELQQKLAAPQWSQVLQAMKDDLTRQYKVDIETNSTLDVEADEDKQMIADLMNAIAQFLNGVAPLVQEGILPFQAAQAMLLAITRKFRFGTEIEDYIKAMQAPQKQDDGKAAELAHKQQVESARLAHDQEAERAKSQQAEIDSQRKHQQALAGDQARLQESQLKIQAEEQADIRRINAERASKLAELNAQRATAEFEAKLQQQTELRKAELVRQTAIDVARIDAEAQAASDERKAAVEKDKADKATAVQVHATEKQAETENKKTDAESKVAEQMTSLVEKVLEGQQQLIQLFSAEKVVNRGKDGKVASIGLRKAA